MFCQLETLRQCLPPSVRRTLDELPESLDETYERVLREIRRPNRDHARRLLQCLVVAIRPLNVEELAEVLAVDFDDAEGIPKLKPDWRWEDEEQALLTSCSSLITTVETADSQIVQFSHFSVKEYLTSERLATSNGAVSRYYIDLEPAHTILAQACLGVLLQPNYRDEENDVGEMSALAGYAAEHWATHAQFERVSSLIRKAMKYLFDLDKPYFAAWTQLYDIDTYPSEQPSSLYFFAVSRKSSATPLYYAALCGFEDLVEHLVVKYPQHVNTSGGHFVSPLVAALERRHFRIVELLHRDGAHVDVHGTNGTTALDSAARFGDLEVVQVLLDHKADVNARDNSGWTPILSLSYGHRHLNIPQLWPDVAQLLLKYGADVNARVNDGRTPLHVAAVQIVEIVRILLEHGANVDAVDNEGRTPLHSAAQYGRVEAVRVLLEHGANVDAVDNEARVPLHSAAREGQVEAFRVLLEHGANAGAVDNKGSTPLHLAWAVEKVRALLEHGANVDAVDNKGRTPLHLAWGVEIAYALLEHGAIVNAVDNEGSTPLHRAWAVEKVRALLEHGANVDAVDNKGKTRLHIAAEYWQIEVTSVLLEHGANVDVVNTEGKTPLHLARGAETIRALLEHGANVDAEDSEGRTPLQIAQVKGDNEVMKLLLEHGDKGGHIGARSLE